jgi:hypothetical protein
MLQWSNVITITIIIIIISGVCTECVPTQLGGWWGMVAARLVDRTRLHQARVASASTCHCSSR